MTAKKIIITGGATRIGAAIANSLANYETAITIHYNKSKNNALKLMQRDFESVVSCSCKSNTCVFKHPHVRVMTDTFNSEMSSYNKSVTNKRSALDKALVKNDCGSFKHYRLNNE